MEGRENLISIVIPTFNRDKTLPFAINSVINQTCGNWELIVVDDGSTDDTKEVIENFLDDSRIKYTYKGNKGVSAARNLGLKLALGDYIVFLDSDDFFSEDLICNINQACLEKPDLICWEVIKIINGKKKKWKPVKLNGLYNNVEATFLAGSVCYKKNLLLEFGGYDQEISFGENYELGQRISGKKNLKIKIINKPLLFYVVKTKGRQSNSLQNRLTSYIYQYKKHRNDYDKNPKVSAEMNYLIGFVLEKSHRKKAALNRYKRSWQDNPWNIKPLLKILYLKFLR